MEDRRPFAAIVTVQKMTQVWQLGGTIACSRALCAMDKPRFIC
jgi:hypothetical protein